MPEYYNVTEVEATAFIDRRLAEAFGPLYRKHDSESCQVAGDSFERIKRDFSALFGEAPKTGDGRRSWCGHGGRAKGAARLFREPRCHLRI